MLHCNCGPKVLDFRAVCVVWVLDVLDHYETGCNQLQGLSLAGLDDLDDTPAFPEELRSYVARTGGLPPAVSAARSADEKCFHSPGLHGRVFLFFFFLAPFSSCCLSLRLFYTGQRPDVLAAAFIQASVLMCLPLFLYRPVS